MYVVYKEEHKIATVISIYYGQVPEGLTEDGIHIEDAPIPHPERIPDMHPILKLDLDKKEFYYDYESEDSLESRVRGLQAENEQLRKDNTRLKDALAELADSQDQAHTATQLALAEIVETIGGGEK